MIYHITSKEEWANAIEKGFFEVASLQLEGFIHCSQEHQVAGVLQRYYSGKINLVKLVIDETKVINKIIYENAPSVNQNFPHIYGTLNIDAVIDVVEIN